jgi:hypothetical protein
MNLCKLPKEQREIAAAETLACFWLHQKRAGKMTRLAIQNKLEAMPEKQRDQHRAALNKYRKDFGEGK